MSTGRHSLNRGRRAELLALAGELRPDLHHYCARLMGSVIEWRDGQISFIHDYRYVRYVTADAELTLAPANPADDGAAQ